VRTSKIRNTKTKATASTVAQIADEPTFSGGFVVFAMMLGFWG
jgi:hypothetical protein